MELEDAETGEGIMVDFGDSAVRDAFQKLTRKERDERDSLFRRMGLDAVNISTRGAYHGTVDAIFSGCEQKKLRDKEQDVIEVDRLTKRYGAFTAVDDISFQVGKGEIVGFLGPNGAGKTTAMRVLTCFLPATEGTAAHCRLRHF